MSEAKLVPASGSAHRCSTYFPSYSAVDPKDECACLLTNGHNGPHQFRCTEGKTWQWETDLQCECEHCQQCNGDYCVDYWELPNMPSGPEKIKSLLNEIEAMFQKESESALCEWNSGGGGGEYTPEEISYHKGRCEQTMFLQRMVRSILSDVIIRHLGGEQASNFPPSRGVVDTRRKATPSAPASGERHATDTTSLSQP